MAKDEKSDFDTLADELAHVYARADQHPDILFIHRNPDGSMGMRIVGFGKHGERWIALAGLEWAKHEILNDADWKPIN